MLPELIGEAIALAGVAGTGYGVGVHNERQRALRPKTLKQLMREQRIKPVRSIDDLPTADPAVFSEADLDAWEPAMREARGR